MKELLLAIRAELKIKITTVKNRDIYIVPDINFMPDKAMSPVITIKDGQITRKELVDNMSDETYPVAICAYIKTHDCSETTQLLDLCKDINDTLDQNLLGISNLLSAVCRKESESQLFFAQNNKQWLIRKIMYFEYEKEVERP